MKTISPRFIGGLVCSLFVWAATSDIQAADAAKQHASNPVIFAISDSPIDPDLDPTMSLAQLPAAGSQPSVPSGTNPTQTPRTPPATPAPGGRAQPTTPSPRSDANALALNSAANNSGLSSLASSSNYGLGSTPNMIGDTLGFQYFIRVESAGGKNTVSLPSGDQSQKISDDTSPIPTDRVFFDYNFFNNALLTANGADIGLNRYTFGLEKTFFDGQCSVEIKAPLDGGLNAIQSPNNTTAGNEGTIFGTLAITPKMLLYQDQQRALAAGMAIGLPTSPDFVVTQPNPMRVLDETVHLAPFLGLLLVPNDTWFSITYLQFDFAADGDTVIQSGNNLGKLHYPTLMYVDESLGYWLFHSGSYDSQRGWITGVAPMIELHYTTTLQNAEGIGPVFPLSLRADSLNMTGGLYFQIGPLSSLLVGGIAPLRTDLGDKEFDAEVVVEFNRRF